jgi:hypothetical protein
MPSFNPRLVLVMCCLSLAFATGCGRTPDPEVESVPEAGARQRDIITRDEILASPHRLVDLYQAVRGLRPHFLTATSSSRSRSYPLSVYLDGVRQQNGIATLGSISARDVERVEYLDAGRAESQYGSRAAGGAIVITLTGQRRVPASARDTTEL